MDWLPEINVHSDKQYKKFLRKAYYQAWKRSDDNSTKIGSIITLPDLSKMISYGVDHFPKDILITEYLLQDKEWKYQNMLTATEDAIAKAKKTKYSLKKAVLVMNWLPWIEQGKQIVNAGIETVIGHKQFVERTPEEYQEKIILGIEYLLENKIQVSLYDGIIHKWPDKWSGGGLWKPTKSILKGVEWRP